MPIVNVENPSPPTAKPRKPRFAATVRQVQRLTPHLLRVTFAGPELAGFVWSGPAAHIKLFFDVNGAPVARTYTPRRFDAARGELDVDFVLHGVGPASDWAAQAAPGQSLQIAGPGKGYATDPDADWMLLAGDDTAIPAIATLIEALPTTMPVTALVEIVESADALPLAPARPGLEVRWLVRGSDPAAAGRLLEAAVQEWVVPAGNGRIYVGCEADALRRIRRHLLQQRSLPVERVVTRGYWKLGATDHPDRDFGE
ncbi:MAG TPA: siderophore-interacting protein [Steroidobacteraceae bacterium]|jgi:NADPH-dependent ferric siderophore reductase|nr:siderophore-interacting protein [Steroidobacteraceae bacterium]